MKGRDVAMLGLALLVSLPLVAAAQGLGDAAARERARREKEAARGHDRRSFSNEDLEKGRPPGADKKKKATSSPASSGQAPSSTSDTATSSEPASPPAGTEPSEPPGPPESATAAIEARIQGLRDKLNPMSGSFIYGATGSNDPAEETRVRSELQEAEAELARARQAESAGGAESGEGSGRTPE